MHYQAGTPFISELSTFVRISYTSPQFYLIDNRTALGTMNLVSLMGFNKSGL